jgi:hypothetical protein
VRTTIICFLAASSAIAADPELIANVSVSREDVLAIRQAVARVTRQSVLTIGPVSVRHYVPGAIVEYADITTNTGLRRIKEYRRTDMVDVTTGYPPFKSGEAYSLQKIRGKWKILPGKGSWIE